MDAVSFETNRPADAFQWGARFRTTRWSIVLSAASEGEEARAALAAIYRAYFYPLAALVARRRGREIANELTQAFFAERLVAAQDLKKLERLPGKRFRAWLAKSLWRFSGNRQKYECQQRRDVRLNVAIGSDGEEHVLPASTLVAAGVDPEQQFARAEALDLLAQPLEELKRRYCERAKALGVDGERRFELTKKVFLPGAAGEEIALDACARELGLSIDATKQLVARMRRSYVRLLDDTLSRKFPGVGLSRVKRRLREALETPPSPRPGR